MSESIAMNIVEIPRISVTPAEFREIHSIQDAPVILEGLDWGPCCEKWADPEYVAQSVGSSEVRIHSSCHPELDFVKKNFAYSTMALDELIRAAAKVEESNGAGDAERKYYYLRALGNDPRGREVADFRTHFPAIAEDFSVPDGLYPEEKHFSSVFRVSSAGLQLWTHYDVMDNILVQVSH